MSNYILKNNDKEKEVILYKEKIKYSFTPKKSFKYVKKVTVLEASAVEAMYKKKIEKEYRKLLILLKELFSDDDSANTLIAFTEIKRIKDHLVSLRPKIKDKKYIDKYLENINDIEYNLLSLEEPEKSKGR